MCVCVCSVLEQRLLAIELQQHKQLEALREERSGLQRVVLQQRQLIEELQSHVRLVSSNNSLAQSQQQQLRETITHLLAICSKDTGIDS